MTFEIAGNNEAHGDLKEEKTAAKRLMETLQYDGFRVFVRLLRTYFVESGVELNNARKKAVRLTKSAYVSSCRATTLKDRVNDEVVEFNDDGWSVVHRVVATKSFYR